MKIRPEELTGILSQFNPWWRGDSMPGVPTWRRAVFKEIFTWVTHPPAPRAVMLSGPRQVGKTSVVLQIIEELLKQGIPAANVLYVTFDHPLLKLAGIEAILEAWRAREPKNEGLEFLFLDEAQFISEWGVWIKHQVDFMKNRRILFTGSAMTLTNEKQESGVGRWHTIQMTTLSFYDYIHLMKAQKESQKQKLQELFSQAPSAFVEGYSKDHFSLSLPEIPSLNTLNDLWSWNSSQLKKTTEAACHYLGHFHEYLLRGGFPQTAQMTGITEAQRLLREDIVEKILKRDMTALFGVRKILTLEQIFIYLCMHDGGLLDMQTLCENLEVKRPTAQNFIEILEQAHLIYRLPPHGYGKEILRAKYKIYLTDSSIAPAVLLSGKAILDQPEKRAMLIETAVFKHLYTHYRQKNTRFTYWHNKDKQEVDLIVEIGALNIPFEIKYRGQHPGKKNLLGLQEFCEKKKVDSGFVITKELNDLGPHPAFSTGKIFRIPALLLCYWLGQMELDPKT